MRCLRIAPLALCLCAASAAAQVEGQEGAWSFRVEDGQRTAAHISTNASLTIVCPGQNRGTLVLQVEAGPVDDITAFVFDNGDTLIVPFERGRFEVDSDGQASVFAQLVDALKARRAVSVDTLEARRLASFSLFGAAEMIGACGPAQP